MLSAVVKEPEVHIIEKYLQISEGFFTKTNIKVDRREIDLLVIIYNKWRKVSCWVHSSYK